MADVRFSLYCSGPEQDTGRGWKMDRETLPAAVTLLLRCINGRWKGWPSWEISVYAQDYGTGLQMDFTGLRWTNEQRKWYERHMKKLLENKGEQYGLEGKR